jgi:hypothetical protein
VASWYQRLGFEPFAARVTGADNRSGFIVPANELVFFREFPLRVDEVKTVAGATLGSESVLTVSGTELVVASQVPVDKIRYVSIGMEVGLVDQNGAVGTGTVTVVGSKPGGAATDGFYAVEIRAKPSATSTDSTNGANNAKTTKNQNDSASEQVISGVFRAVAPGLALTVNYPIQRSKEPLLSVPVTGMFPCSSAMPGTECIRITTETAETFHEVRVVRIMTSSTGLAGFEQPVASVREGDLVLINNPGASTSEESPGPEDLGGFAEPTSTVGGSEK